MSQSHPRAYIDQSHRREMALRISLCMTGTLPGAIGGLISFGLVRAHTSLLQGWQFLFLVRRHPYLRQAVLTVIPDRSNSDSLRRSRHPILPPVFPVLVDVLDAPRACYRTGPFEQGPEAIVTRWRKWLGKLQARRPGYQLLALHDRLRQLQHRCCHGLLLPAHCAY